MLHCHPLLFHSKLYHLRRVQEVVQCNLQLQDDSIAYEEVVIVIYCKIWCITYFPHILANDRDISSGPQQDTQQWNSPCSCPLQSTDHVMHKYMWHFPRTHKVCCRQNHFSDSCLQVVADQHIGSIHSHQSVMESLFISLLSYFFTPLTYRSCWRPGSIPLTMKINAVIKYCVIRSVFD